MAIITRSQRPPRPQPEPELDATEDELLTALYGTVQTYHHEDPIAAYWKDRGDRTGAYPRLLAVHLIGDGPGWFQFSDGMVLTLAPNGAVEELGVIVAAGLRAEDV